MFMSPYSWFQQPVSGIGSTMCAIHFRGPSIRQGSFNTLINGCLLLGTPTCCLNTWTLLMVSLVVHLGTLSVRQVHPFSPGPLTSPSPLTTNIHYPASDQVNQVQEGSKFGNRLRIRRSPKPLPMSLPPLTKNHCGYPEGNFGGNQLLGGSMSLSHLYPHLTNDLHINNATDLHQGFPWLRPVQAQFTTIRVLTPVLRRHALRPVILFTPSLFSKRRLALQLNSLIRVSRRAHLRCLTLDKFRYCCTLCRRILFIVRSHYLYSIGLLTIFSFGWGIPPVLRQQSQATRLSKG